MAVHLMRNLTKQRAIIPIHGKPSLIFGRAGAEDGSDIVPVSDEDAETPSVYDALRRGQVEFVDDSPDSEVLKRVEENRRIMEERRASDPATVIDEEGKRVPAASEVIDRQVQDRSVSGATCVGPNANNPNLPCGVLVVRPAVVSGQEPPLCDAHSHLAPNYIATEIEGEPTDEFPFGKPEVRWTRGQVDMRR